MAFRPIPSSARYWIRFVWFERRSDRSLEAQAIGLDLAELVAVQPRHTRRPPGAGVRLGSGERSGRGWAQTLDFDGISPYQTGDDVRWIHWLATARSGNVQMRRFAAESHRARMLVVDLHPALYFGTRDRLMAKTAALVAARLAWEAFATQEPVGLATGLDAAVLPPRRGRRHVMRLLERLQADYTAVGPDTVDPDMPAVLQQVSPMLRPGDEICLISDFGALDPGFEKRSTALAERRSLRAIVVEDPMFRDAIPSGRYPLRDAARRRRDTAIVRQDTADMTAATIARLRRDRRRQLQNCGWSVEDALDILPREQRP